MLMITMHAIIMDGGPHQFFSSNFCFRLKEAKSQASQAASGRFLDQIVRSIRHLYSNLPHFERRILIALKPVVELLKN